MSVLISDIGLQFCFVWYLYLVLVSGLWWTCRMSFGSSSAIFGKGFRRIGANPSLNS